MPQDQFNSIGKRFKAFGRAITHSPATFEIFSPAGERNYDYKMEEHGIMRGKPRGYAMESERGNRVAPGGAGVARNSSIDDESDGAVMKARRKRGVGK